MPERWTGELLADMHVQRVTAKRLAEEIGWNSKYLSAVLNGRVTPKKAEEKLRAALSSIIAKQ